MKTKVLTCLVALLVVAKCEVLKQKFAWKELKFSWPSDELRQKAIEEEKYIPSNNLPLSFDVWKNKIFLTVPRWKTGVASTLNYIEISDEQSPILHPYPSWEMNRLSVSDEDSTQNPNIISSFGIRIDECDRLWVVDSGIADLLGQPTKWRNFSIFIFDLNTNNIIKHYEIPQNQIKESSFLVNIFVDVVPGRCHETFAYILDIYGYGIIVYDLEQHKSHRINHNYFAFDPLQGNLNVGGVNFQWHDGIFGIALGKIQNENGDRTIYFHALASTYEFSVSNRVLKNETFSTSPDSYYAFKVLGDRGRNTQSSAEVFDELTDVIFYTQINRDAVGCWNTKKPFTVTNQGLVESDSTTLMFPNELRSDGNGNLWILSNRMPVFIYSQLKPDFNYRILVGNTSEIIMGTPCEL